MIKSTTAPVCSTTEVALTNEK